MPKAKYMKPEMLGSMKKQSSPERFFNPSYLKDGVIITHATWCMSQAAEDPEGYLQAFIKMKKRAA